ncbi:tRNA uridine-5-carboxymethylaminomethyl(34) synthesis GTPase MnmE [Alphaproteobacteria bacterium]|nr:tRNA uridine-5-carboxymethylaminomethyl(34) synthesis GTPase MnmE [Alphaproteobacteria bacterium]
MSDATIFALSTAPVRAAVAIIRLSGGDCGAALGALGVTDVPPPRQAALRRLHAPESGALLDEALLLRFQAPHSFTGEDMLELHVHGGLAVTQSILAALSSIDGLRMAEAGEFTRRAVVNGKMDLTAAEAIADLIDAEGGAQQARALDQLRGQLKDQAEAWRTQLKTMLAHLEADLEFADEDLPGGLGQTALEGLPALRDGLAAHVGDKRGLRLRDGVRVAFLGAPNAGKSSILNMLAGREAAIVSARAGTTRDAIEVAMVLDGVPVTLVDTAGLRAAGDDIEREGVRRAEQAAEQADIVVLVSAPDAALPSGDMKQRLAAADLRLANKSDIEPNATSDKNPKGALAAKDGSCDIALSAKTGDGAEALLARLGELVRDKAGLGGGVLVTRQRHAEILEDVVAHLDAAQHAPALELAAEDLRLAQRALGRLTGAVDVEQLLDIVFADFCIGK